MTSKGKFHVLFVSYHEWFNPFLERCYVVSFRLVFLQSKWKRELTGVCEYFTLYWIYFTKRIIVGGVRSSLCLQVQDGGRHLQALVAQAVFRIPRHLPSGSISETPSMTASLSPSSTGSVSDTASPSQTSSASSTPSPSVSATVSPTESISPAKKMIAHWRERISRWFKKWIDLY